MEPKPSKSFKTYFALAVSAMLASLATLYRGPEIFYQALPAAPFVLFALFLAYRYQQSALSSKDLAVESLPRDENKTQRSDKNLPEKRREDIEAPTPQETAPEQTPSPDPAPSASKDAAPKTQVTPDPFKKIKQYKESGADLRLLKLNEKEVSVLTGRSVSSLQKDRMKGKGLPFHKDPVSRLIDYYYLEIMDYIKDSSKRSE